LLESLATVMIILHGEREPRVRAKLCFVDNPIVNLTREQEKTPQLLQSQCPRELANT